MQTQGTAFSPFVLTTYGQIHPDAAGFLRELVQYGASYRKDLSLAKAKIASHHLYQRALSRLSVAVVKSVGLRIQQCMRAARMRRTGATAHVDPQLVNIVYGYPPLGACSSFGGSSPAPTDIGQ